MAEEGFREIADEFCSDYIFMDNPFNGEDHTGYLLFINERDPKLIKALADSLDGYVEVFSERSNTITSLTAYTSARMMRLMKS